MSEMESSFQDKLKMYENLLRTYQEELDKKSKEAMKLRVDLDLLNTKYTALINKNPKENSNISKSLQEELQQKNIHLENVKSTLTTLKETLRKAEKKNALLKLEIDKKEDFIKEILYEKKQIEMNLEEKTLQLKEFSDSEPMIRKKDGNQDKAFSQVEQELKLSKDINKTLITMLKWKNIELEQVKNSNNQSSSEEDYEEKIMKFKAQEKVLLGKLSQQMQDFAKLSNSSLEE